MRVRVCELSLYKIRSSTYLDPYKYYVKDFFVRYGTPPKRLDVHQRAIHHSKANETL